MKKLTKKTKQQRCRCGYELLNDPTLNKGTAFTKEEREALGLNGLLPPHVHTQKEQVMRTMRNFHIQPSAISKYHYLMGVKNRNETLFYRTLADNIEEIMPIVYTPTIGEVCMEYGNIFRYPEGLFIAAEDKGNIEKILRNWPHKDVRVIVVTDGERILGLGDLGANGMGIPVGKLSLYTACAGIDPATCLPITIDVGTNNEDLLKNIFYLGTKHKRVRGIAYDVLLKEFFTAVRKVFPKALIQLEDFATSNAFGLLSRYRKDYCVFNDDIQGTASVAVAGIYSALKITKGRLSDQKFLFMGMGEAGLGIGRLITAALLEEGLSLEEARKHCYFCDSKGLVTTNRSDLNDNKREFAQNIPDTSDLLTAVKVIKPTALIGVCGQPKAFTRAVIEEMARNNERPIVFALSNPSSKAECSAQEAYEWSKGQAIFASGSPFAPVTMNDKTLVPGQGNNAYIFPGVGLGVLVAGAKVVLDEMFLAAAKTLAQEVTTQDLTQGRIYPPLTKIRAISAKIAQAVALIAYEKKIAKYPRPKDLADAVKAQMYEPDYKKLA